MTAELARIAALEAGLARRDERIAELEQLVNALRCGDLIAFCDGELPAERAAAFRDHLASCAACGGGLADLMQLDAHISVLARAR